MIRREQLIELLAERLRYWVGELIAGEFDDTTDPAYEVATTLVDEVIVPFYVSNLEIEDSGQFADDD